MGDRNKAFWLGLFIIVALGLAAWFILFLKPAVGDGKVTLTVRFSNIDKISEGTLVTFGGKPVGEVVRIKEIRDPREAPADAFGNLYIYELILKVDSSVRVFTYDEITFATAGLLGEKSIAIIPKAGPPGSVPAQEVTREVLYARSTDKWDETLNKLTNVAGTLNDALGEVSIFIETNNKDLNEALRTLSSAAKEVQTFMASANENKLCCQLSSAAENIIVAMDRANTFFASAEQAFLVERLGASFDAVYDAASLLAHGRGTLAHLVNSDNFYVQITTVLCQIQQVLHDINTYGLLYQFDRRWQRSQNARRDCTEIPTVGYCQQ